MKSHPDKANGKGQVGSLSLEQIKGHMEAEKLWFDDIQKQALWKKEQELADEVQQ